MVPTSLLLRNVGKVIYVADVTTKSSSKLSTGQVAAIIVCLAVAIVGGFATYAYYMENACCCCCMLVFDRNRRSVDYDDDDEDKPRFGSRLGGLWTGAVDKKRALWGMIRDKTRRREAVHGSDTELDSEAKLKDDSDLY
ncbi:hypothetical protein B0T14DRAFT_604481 [Immersiella caudata]|uniref:Uncharacterized protein n=1 Tax=Immersiella caudata TaxID=314043 RepID=A0AA40C101_9PEZI|nr:hypothetical protein B0T14DRAFT_604481 [Immersiella caudata]